MALGLTQEQACALNNVGHTTFKEWKDRPEFSSLRARAEAVRHQGTIGEERRVRFQELLALTHTAEGTPAVHCKHVR